VFFLGKWFRKRAPGHRRDISQIDTVAVNTARYMQTLNSSVCAGKLVYRISERKSLKFGNKKKAKFVLHFDNAKRTFQGVHNPEKHLLL
jgi:hypothetical protein